MFETEAFETDDAQLSAPARNPRPLSGEEQACPRTTYDANSEPDIWLVVPVLRPFERIVNDVGQRGRQRAASQRRVLELDCEPAQ